MQAETKTCQNCKKDFIIEPEDFKFYEKIKVPPPTFCPECRLVRRLIWRNERNLYKDICALCKKNIISVYAPSSPYLIICPNCWWSDGWNGTENGKSYDFNRSFFEQFNELLKKVPLASLSQTNVINSPYSNYVGNSKNIYLSYSVLFDSENIYYSRFVDDSKQIFDSFDMVQSEKCYENINCEKNYNAHFTYHSKNILDSIFIYNCANVSNCFICTNLRNQKYCYKNESYSKEEYKKIVESYNLGSRQGLERAKKEFLELYNQTFHRFSHTVNTTNSTGEDLRNCKNVKCSFNVNNSEDSKYLFRCISIKDVMDSIHLEHADQIYEYSNAGGGGSQNLKFCINLKTANFNVEYSAYCCSISNCFGCVGIRNKKYCILNKQYTKGEYEKLIPKIIQHMKDMPYIDKKGNVYKYGEFFPSELSPFAYNESVANEHFPKNKAEIISSGFRFRERENRDYKITMSAKNIPSNIKDVSNKILDEIIACENSGKEETLCTEAFKIVPEELSFYRNMNLPLPTKCPNCRYFDRIFFKNPLKLWHRKCMKEGCQNEFETSYAPDRPEIVYCERCYQQEVY